MNGTRRWTLLVGCLCALAMLAATHASAPVIAPVIGPAKAKATKVTLTRRTENEAYGKSAYSFRYLSRDADEHGNDVDLLFDNCGNLHIDAPGSMHRVVRVDAKKLENVEVLPDDGWSTKCFSPRKSDIYVLQIDGEQKKFGVKLRVLEVKPEKITFEWLPFVGRPERQRGFSGMCGGPHDCS